MRGDKEEKKTPTVFSSWRYEFRKMDERIQHMIWKALSGISRRGYHKGNPDLLGAYASLPGVIPLPIPWGCAKVDRRSPLQIRL